MKRPARIVAIGAVLALSACFPRTEEAPEGIAPVAELTDQAVESEAIAEPETGPKKAAIDWNAARADFANQDSDTVTTQGSGNVAVPILLPEIPVTIQSDGPPPLRFTEVPDGYFAVVTGEAYDVIINGTDRLLAAPSNLPEIDASQMRFEDTMTGSQISFNRYGASYLVEFACKGPPNANSCIEEDDAKQAVEELLLAGTQ
ncbi:MAG: hypothetical protein AAF613_07890 [Pseudomonadota bacterium]